jgi:hypothetical protein
MAWRQRTRSFYDVAIAVVRCVGGEGAMWQQSDIVHSLVFVGQVSTKVLLQLSWSQFPKSGTAEVSSYLVFVREPGRTRRHSALGRSPPQLPGTYGTKYICLITYFCH